MERVRCLKCGSIGYTASPGGARCSECKGKLKLANSDLTNKEQKLGVKKLSFCALTIRQINGIFFVHEITFCSLNKLGTLKHVRALSHWGYLMMCVSPGDLRFLENKASYLFI
jgi:putative hemolysin